MSYQEHFEVRWNVTKDRDSYFESDTSYQIDIIRKKNDEILHTFHRSEYDNSQGSFHRGFKDVEFTLIQNETYKMVVHFEDNKTREFIVS